MPRKPSRDKCLQTISVPYVVDDDGRALLETLRRDYSRAVRTAYTRADEYDTEKDLRDHLKTMFYRGQNSLLDAWGYHCATREGLDLRKARPDGKMIFGTKAMFRRRMKGLVDKETWRRSRLRPLVSLGHKDFAGNRHFRLVDDGTKCRFHMLDHDVDLHLVSMHGNAGRLVEQVAKLASEKSINLTFKIDDHRLHITFDATEVPDHPQRKVPTRTVEGRSIGIDLNPNWVGITVIENRGDVSKLSETKVLDHVLIDLREAAGLSPTPKKEVLAAVANRIVGTARKWGNQIIFMERGLGHLGASTKSRALNRTINGWERSILFGMMKRRAMLSGIDVVETWGGYSTTIGNLSFDLPDACASAAEIARRGLAHRAKKELLPCFEEGWCPRRWKDVDLPVEAGTWVEVHRRLKTAKIGVRRPHPDVREGGKDSDRRRKGFTTVDGYAVLAVDRRRKPRGIALRRIVDLPRARDSRHPKTVVDNSREVAGVDLE